MHDRLTRFEANSELSRFNASRGRWFAISPELEALLRESLRAFEISDGLVNVGVLPALIAAGYARDFAAGPTPTTAAPRIPPLVEVLHVRPGEARLMSGGAVDLGGIAKGWLADRVAERLGENVLVNLCGDLFARGGGETGEGWPVGFGDRTLLLKDLGAATSGTTKRSWAAGHHLIDPRTGLPARSDLSDGCGGLRKGRATARFARCPEVARVAVVGVVAGLTHSCASRIRRSLTASLLENQTGTLAGPGPAPFASPPTRRWTGGRQRYRGDLCYRYR
jgi:thiamine biosynthesis lipoprotein